VAYNSVREDAALNQHLFILVIRSQLSCVDDRVPDNIGTPACPESLDASFLYNFGVTVNAALVLGRNASDFVNALSLQFNLNQISRISNCNGHTACDQRSQDFLGQTRKLPLLQWTSDHVPDWYIHANTKACEDNLPLKSCRESSPKSQCAFLSCYRFHCSEEALVARSLACFDFLHLESHLGCIDGKRCHFCDTSSETCHSNVSEKES
jgi:hypothetical protein